MARHNIQPSMAGGEASPSMYARVDLQKYASLLKRARNVNVLPQGGVRNRAGTKMVAAAGDSANPVRLIEFIFSNDQAFILEFGHQYIRFFTNDGQVLLAGNPYQIASPYSGTDLFELKVTQSADVLYIVHPSYAPRQLTRITNTNWTLALFAYKNGPFMLQNTDQTNLIFLTIPNWTTATLYTIGQGVRNGGIDYIATVTHTSGVFATDLAAGRIIVAYTVGGAGIFMTATLPTFNAQQVGALWEIVHTLPTQTANDRITTTATAGQTIRAGHNWNIITDGDWIGTVYLQKSNDGGITWITLRTFLSNNGANNYNTSGDTGEDQTLLRIYVDTLTSGTWVSTLNADSFEWHGVVKITSFGSSTVVIVSVETMPANVNPNATFEWSEGSWSNYRGWPTAVAFYQDRLVFASTAAEPQTVWMSKTADYINFGMSRPVLDDDAISIVISSRRINVIRNLVVLQTLLALTSDAEFGIGAIGSGAITPTTVDIQTFSHRGSASVEPALIGNEIILMQPLSSAVRNFIFQLAVQGYMGDNLSAISQHLFTGYTIKEMAYQQEPDSIVWMIRNDGKMISLTYMREQEMQAFTWHDSVGTFESVACIPSTANKFDEPWMVYNLSGTRYIVRLVKRDQGIVPADQFFVDCGLSYDGVPATTITGLAHLNGRAVSVLADGFVIPGKTVAGGQITLDVAASKVHVGVPYVSDVETMKIEAPDGKGTLQGRRVAIPEVTIRFWDSRGGWIGVDRPSDDGVVGLDPIYQRDVIDNWGVPIPLKTGDYLMTLPGGYDFGAHLFFRQVDPLPFTVTAFLPQLKPGEN